MSPDPDLCTTQGLDVGCTPPPSFTCAKAIALPLRKCVVSVHLQVLKEVTGKPTLYYREGGTIPAMALIKKELGIDMTMFAFGLPDDRIHAPNERYA